MIITKMKAKNQVTIPKEIVRRLRLRNNELFQVDVESSYIRLTPVDVEPRYTAEELDKIDYIVEKEKHAGKTVKPGKEFLDEIRNITK